MHETERLMTPPPELYTTSGRTRITGRLALIALCLAAVSPLGASDKRLTPILEDLPISSAQKTPQQTPIAHTSDPYVYIVNVEPGDAGDSDDISLHTVIRQGRRADDGSWEWRSQLIEERTVHDEWHTVPAVGVDRQGHVHVAYNMHNFPWQYKVSRLPDDISAFEFRGERISESDLLDHKLENRTSYPGAGTADIPGNQITYPAFFSDRDGELYVTYRFAAKPARRFNERTMSAGIARYELDSETWQPVGGPLAIESGDVKRAFFRRLQHPITFAGKSGWTAYHPRLAFGDGRTVHVLWFWREGTAGSKITRPCLVTTTDLASFQHPNGEPSAPPFSPDDCSNIDIDESEAFYSLGNMTSDRHGYPWFVLSPVESSRAIVWQDEQGIHRMDSPYSATEIFFDQQDRLWALASGLVIHRKDPGQDDWTLIYKSDEKQYCRPRASVDTGSNTAFIYAPHCREDKVSVFSLDLND